ncbi:MAG: hypothetical protein NC453_24905, partial [Muribaculum sp.]|nr:hypothetical protein [Muribaculum sp.]
MKRNYKITICGGGSLGLVCAGVFLSKGFNVNIFTGHPENWNKEIKVYDPDGKEFGGDIDRISNNPEDVISDCDIIFLTLPGYLIEKTLKRIKPFLKKNAIVGSVVSSTGFFFMAHDILGNEYPLFGFQRVPYIRELEFLRFLKIIFIFVINRLLPRFPKIQEQLGIFFTSDVQ